MPYAIMDYATREVEVIVSDDLMPSDKAASYLMAMMTSIKSPLVIAQYDLAQQNTIPGDAEWILTRIEIYTDVVNPEIERHIVNFANTIVFNMRDTLPREGAFMMRNFGDSLELRWLESAEAFPNDSVPHC